MRLTLLIISTYAIVGVALLVAIVAFQALYPYVEDKSGLQFVIGVPLFALSFFSRRIAEKCSGISMKEELSKIKTSNK